MPSLPARDLIETGLRDLREQRFDQKTSQLRASLTRLKEDLQLNFELASPDDFIHALPDWEERSPYIAKRAPA